MATDDIQEYIGKIRPVFAEGYRVARLVTGERELADVALQRAVLRAYVYRHDLRERMGFREGFFHMVKTQALKARRDAGGAAPLEEEYIDALVHNAQPAEKLDAIHAALYGQLKSGETPKARRQALLYYGCGLSPRQIAQAVSARPREVAESLRLSRARMRRSIKRRWSGVNMAELEERLEWLARAMVLRSPGEDVPDMGELLSEFEDEARRASRPRFSAGRAIRAILYIVGALVCGVLFWLFAVLLEPPATVTSAPTQISEDG